ncbi:MAG: hypothetical protein QM757_44720 [Paludibaculum sp.]
MFPTGVAGVGLLLLRISLAAVLLVDGTGRWSLVTSSWLFLLYGLPSAALCLGFLTPYSALLGCLLEFRALWMTKGTDGFHLATGIVATAVLALLGPGAYSVDGRLFGRRLLNVPARELDGSVERDEL